MFDFVICKYARQSVTDVAKLAHEEVGQCQDDVRYLEEEPEKVTMLAPRFVDDYLDCHVRKERKVVRICKSLEKLVAFLSVIDYIL